MRIPTRKSRVRRPSTLKRTTAMQKMKSTKRRGLQMGTPVLMKRAKKPNTFTSAILDPLRKKRTLTATALAWKDGEPPEDVAIDSSGSTRLRAGMVPALNSNIVAGRLWTKFGKDLAPFLLKDSSRVKYSGGNYESAAGKQYYTTFEVGVPSSRAVQQLGRQNGVSDITIANTQYDNLGEIDSSNRQYYTLSCGFNQKNMSVVNEAHVTDVDIANVYDIYDIRFNRDKKQRIYGMTKYIWQKMKLMNTNAYKSSVVKISLYAQRKTFTNTAAGMIDFILPNAAELADQTGKMPNRYVMGTRVSLGGINSGLCDPSIGPEMSPAFANNYEHVKSFSKKLRPGEHWDFKYVHHLGSGIRLDRLKDVEERAGAPVPIGYVMLIEFKGTLCEGIIQNSTNPDANGSSVLGLSPAYIQIEYSRGHCSVLDSTPSFSESEAFGGILTGFSEYAIRAFTEREPTLNTRINVDASLVGGKSEPGKDLYIPVMTDQFTTYASKVEDND